jgi:hypothetical protein
MGRDPALASSMRPPATEGAMKALWRSAGAPRTIAMSRAWFSRSTRVPRGACMHGRIRSGPEARWMPIVAEQRGLVAGGRTPPAPS